MEFKCVKVQLCSIGMQALLERQISGAGGIPAFQSFPDHGHDHLLVQQVIDGSIEVLYTAAHLTTSSALRYAPIRVLQRIVSASIFLLKAMSLGVQGTKLSMALTAIADTIAALRQSAVDDVQLSCRYADLLEICVEGLRNKFVSYNTGSALQQAATDTVSNFGVDTLDSASSLAPEQSLHAENDPLGADWLRLPVDPSLLAMDSLDSYNYSWLDDKSLDFLQTLDDWPVTI